MSAELFDQHWQRDPFTGCHVWIGAKTAAGYGTLRINKKPYYAHRFAYEAKNGPLGGLLACHKCDNPSCVNPEHIFAGTQKDNMRDQSEKKRFKNQNMSKTHCHLGHELSGKNLSLVHRKNTTHRQCRRCLADATARYKQRKKVGEKA